MTARGTEQASLDSLQDMPQRPKQFACMGSPSKTAELSNWEASSPHFDSPPPDTPYRMEIKVVVTLAYLAIPT